MRHSITPWRRRSAAALVAGLLLLPGCVTRGSYRKVVAERDRVLEERDALKVRVDHLETGQQALEDERAKLMDQTEDLRQKREALAMDVKKAQNSLDRTKQQLADTESALAAQRQAQADAAAAADQQMKQLRASYDGLVGDLQNEVESGRVELERLRGTGFSLPDDVVFAPGSAEPTPAGRRLIRSLAGRLAKVKQLIEVHGYTDSLPTQGALAKRYPTNWELAGARAASVVRILVDGGVPADHLVAVSHGASVPIASNKTPQGRAKNRRIEIQLRPLPTPPGHAGAASAPGS